MKNKFNVSSYTGNRNNIVNLISGSDKKILDIGCSTGIIGENIKKIYNSEVIGIELDKEMAQIAKTRLDKVIVGDIERLKLAKYFREKYFDYIIFADILEHLRDPWETLGKVANLLSEDGFIIASIPNVGHYSTCLSLLFGYWPYTNRGIHDINHLRFFTLKSIYEMFKEANLRIVSLKRNYRIIEKPNRINKLFKYTPVLIFKEKLTFQYIILAKRNQ